MPTDKLARKSPISRRSDHTLRLFLKRTVAAQIHLLGFTLAGLGLALLLSLTWHKADANQFWACGTFGLTALLVFGISTVYHFLSDGLEISPVLHQWFEDIDHFAIYLFIAGTYTPVLLNTLEPAAQPLMIGLVWVVAMAGIFYTHFKSRLPVWAQSRFFSTGIFVAMGWIALLRVSTIIGNMSVVGRTGIVAGALFYTFGAVVYALKRPVLIKDVFGFHELWHVMVLGGYLCHYVSVLNFYLKF